MIEVEQLEVAFQAGGSLFRTAKLTVVQDVTLSIARGEVLGLAGEVRQRQDHDRTRHPASDRADQRPHPARRRRHHASGPRRAASHAATHADDLPGPVFQSRSKDLGMLFIAHDLAVVQHVSDRVAVLYLGRVMEVAPSRALYAPPRHPYTAALIEAAPAPDPSLRGTRRLLQGEIPGPESPPSGCVFRTRCPYAIDACSQVVPALTEVAPGHLKACIRNDILVPVHERENTTMRAGL